MASFNKIQIVGYLGRNPELRYTPSGTAVCDFSMATSERKRGRDGEDAQETTTWFRVTFWGRQAEVANQYLEKGKLVFVEGRLSQREWTDKDGNKRTSLEVHGTDLQFIGSREDAGERGEASHSRAAGTGARGGSRSSRQEAPEDRPIDDDDIPF